MRLPPHAGAAAQSAGRYQPGRTNASDCAAHPDRRARGTRHARAKRPFAPHHARRRTGDSDRTKQAMSGAQYRRHRRSGWSAHGAVLEFFSRRDSIGKFSERVPAICQRRHYTVTRAPRPNAQIVQKNTPRSRPRHCPPSPATPSPFLSTSFTTQRKADTQQTPDIGGMRNKAHKVMQPPGQTGFIQNPPSWPAAIESRMRNAA